MLIFVRKEISGHRCLNFFFRKNKQPYKKNIFIDRSINLLEAVEKKSHLLDFSSARAFSHKNSRAVTKYVKIHFHDLQI